MFAFNHFNFNVTDLERSIAFYHDALGLEPVRRKEAADGSFIRHRNVLFEEDEYVINIGPQHPAEDVQKALGAGAHHDLFRPAFYVPGLKAVFRQGVEQALLPLG